MELLSTTTYWAGVVLCAFGAMISFFQINSAWADAHKWNGKFAAIGAGLVIATAFFISMAVKTSH